MTKNLPSGFYRVEANNDHIIGVIFYEYLLTFTASRPNVNNNYRQVKIRVNNQCQCDCTNIE